MTLTGYNLEQRSVKARLSALSAFLFDLGINLRPENRFDYFSCDADALKERLSYGIHHPAAQELASVLKMAKYPLRELNDVVCLSLESIEPHRYPERDFNYIGLEHVPSHRGAPTAIPSYMGSEVLSKALVLKENDLLFAGLRPYLNKVFVLGDTENAIGSAEWFVCRPKPSVSVSLPFLKFYLLSEAVLRQTKWILSGASYPRLDPGDFLELKVVLPPSLSEQGSIASRIESEFEKADHFEEEAQKTKSQARTWFERELPYGTAYSIQDGR